MGGAAIGFLKLIEIAKKGSIKMKTLKKSLAMLLALVMSLGCMSVGAWADVEPTSEPTQEPEQGSYSVTDAKSGETYNNLYKVAEGFYQDGAKYDSTSNFYITNKDGLKYFRDWVNGTSAAWNAYEGFLNLSLASFASNNGMAGKNVHLLADIDLTGEAWQPIGPNSGAVADKFATNWKAHFYGSFYGHNHVVSNMDTSESDQGDKYSRWPQGFFGSIANAGVIDGLILENVTAYHRYNGYSESYAGAIVGNLGSNAVTISNCVVRGNIQITGGWAGAIYGIGNGNIINCTVNASAGSKITGSSGAGGLVGAERNGGQDLVITGNKVSGVEISSSYQYAGGLVGAMSSGAAGTLTIGGNDVAGDVVVSGKYSDKLIVEFDDAGKATLSEGWYSTVIKYPVAQIGNEYYTTLAEAIAAVPTDGTETTITMVGDIDEELTEDVGSTGAYWKIAAGQNIVLDLNGHTIKLKEGVCQPDPKTAKSYAMFENKGTFTVDDTSAAGTGSILFNHPYYKMYNSSFTAIKYNIARNDISNHGTFVLNNGLIKQEAFEVEGYTDGAGTAMYTVDNYVGSSFTMNGGHLYNYFSNAVRVFDNGPAAGSITFNGGLVEGYNSVWLQYTNNTTLTINGGTFKTTAKNYPDSNTQLYSSSKSSTSLNVVITGGTFYESVSFYAKNIDLSVTGGTFKEWLEAYDYSGNGFKHAQVSGGNFMDVCLQYQQGDSWYWKDSITGGLFSTAPESTYETSSGTSTRDYPNCIAPDHAAVQVTEGDYEGWYLVGPIQYASREIITVDEDTYLVKSYVEDDAQNELEVASTSVSVASITEESIAAEEVKTTETVSLANVKTKNVAETAAAMAVAAGATDATDINVTIKLEKQDDTEAQSDNLVETFGGAQEVFEVHPVATYTATKTVGDEVQTIATETFTIANDDLEGSFTFNLYLDSTKYSGLEAGNLVTVTHYKDDNTTETWNKKVQQDEDGNLYVELTLSSFSHVAVKANSDPTATVDYTVKIADATSGTAVIYPGDSVTMNVTVSGDDFYGGDFTIEYDKTAFDLGEVSLPAGIEVQASVTDVDTTDDTKYQLNYNLVNGGARLADGSKILSLTFTAKSNLTETKEYDFKVVSASVNYNNEENADDAEIISNDKVKVNATQYTVKFDGESHDWEYSVYQGKGVDTIPTDVKTGYTFKGWALTDTATTALTNEEIRNAAVTADVIYYPVFEAEQYDVTLSGATGDAKATFGQDYTATISDYDANNYDYTVTYKSGTDASKTLELTEDSFDAETGKFIIPAADITGALTVTVEKTLKGFEVELHADYVTGYTLVLVKAAEGNNSNPTYTYDDGAMFFVNELNKADNSKAYGAYAILVEGAITESAARAKVGITTATATELDIQTDVNATGLIDSSDLQAAFSGYKVQLTLPTQMAIYLRADVNGDYKLDTADVGLVNNARAQ